MSPSPALVASITAHKIHATLPWCIKQGVNGLIMMSESLLGVASSPGPLFILGLVCENTSCYVTLDQRGCVHGDAMTSFQSVYGQVVAWCETDDRIAS